MARNDEFKGVSLGSSAGLRRVSETGIAQEKLKIEPSAFSTISNYSSRYITLHLANVGDVLLTVPRYIEVFGSCATQPNKLQMAYPYRKRFEALHRANNETWGPTCDCICM